MTTELFEPLTPADCDLQDFAFMPLDVGRLRDSDLAADETPEACWAAVLLWAASWHQVPAASIPDSDVWIAKQAGYAQRGKIDRGWAQVRDGALRGWVKCADGRLYHPVVAEKAREAWQAKLAQRWRSECARIKKHNQRNKTSVPTPDFDTWTAQGRPTGHQLPVPRDNTQSPESVTRDEASKRQGEGQGQGDLNTSVPDGTGAEAPKAPAELTKQELWAAGKSLLLQAGMPAAQCGSFVGKLVKDYTDTIVVEAVRSAVVQQPADPASFLKATCQRLAGERRAGASDDKFSVAGNDYSASRAAAEASMARAGITVPETDDIPL
ncbi:MAG: hypothetical protein K0R43_1716 [Pseudoduganella sp.]|jgi:hypothetical protein|nr:hypothetical protein [Pseudoduganella sp.]